MRLSTPERVTATRRRQTPIQRQNLAAYGLNEAWVHRTIRKTFPQVGKVPLEHGWHGTFAMNGNHIPRLHLMDDKMVMITSYNGRGIGPGTASHPT